MSIKTALFTAAFSRYPIKRAFQAAAKNGYDAIETGGFRPHAYAPDLAQGDDSKIRKLSEQYNLPIVSYAPENTGSPYSLVFEDKRLNQESLEYFKLSLDMAKSINASYCMFACNHPGYGRNKEEVKKLFLDNMLILTEHAEKIGQTIILEPVTPFEGTIITTSDDAAWAVKTINSPRFKAMLDLACPMTTCEPVCSYFEKLGTDIKHIHFIDANKDSEDHYIPGDASIDFPRLVDYLYEINYTGYLSLELFSMYINEPDFAAQRGMQVYKELLAKHVQ